MEALVDSIMRKGVKTIDPDATVLDAAMSLSVLSDGCLVVTRDNSVIGILTETDIIGKVIANEADPGKVYVKDIMSTPVITVNANASLVKAAELITEYNIRRLVVVDDSGGFVGLMSTEDLARWLAHRNDFRDAALNAVARLKEKEQSSGPYR